MELVLDLDHTLLNAVEAPGVGLPPPGAAFTLQSPGGGEELLPAAAARRARVVPRAGGADRQAPRLHDGNGVVLREVMTLVDPKAGTDGQLVTGKLLCRDDGQAAAFDKSLEHVCKGAYSKEWSSFIVLDDKEEAWDGPSRKHVLNARRSSTLTPRRRGRGRRRRRASTPRCSTCSACCAPSTSSGAEDRASVVHTLDSAPQGARGRAPRALRRAALRRAAAALRVLASRRGLRATCTT